MVRWRTMALAPSTSAAVKEFAARARARLGARRVGRVVLFGSHARAEARDDSDVDLLVVVEGLTSVDGRDIDAIVGEILTRTDVLLSPLVLSAARYDELRARERCLVGDIDREGIAV
jgi:predicted nucleotidyltransferase